ncbi:ribbon-helix-helix protein, CopG family [Anabaena sp. PCC 7108]|uniref:plasmid mobilization protein n=1 Tax=Anabaena sp. PCC 7108 TaxID=163908 RepID=UPI0005A98F7C|nr:ribbon-helix-helix protein, CopG family [Anabaena sp. PCC 7108]
MPKKTQRTDGVIRTIRLSVRFAADEYEQLKQKAKEGRVSITEFIRRAAFRRRVVELPPPPQLNWKLYTELNAIGVNLNQIATAATRASKAGEAVNIDPEQLQNLVESLRASIKETQMQLLDCEIRDVEQEDLI